jgi:hypothetical protein
MEVIARVDDSDASLEAVVKVTLSTTTSKNLCLHDEIIGLYSLSDMSQLSI